MTNTLDEQLTAQKFDSVIESIIEFYDAYNECFSNVYKCFEKIDKNGGEDENSNETNDIIKYLRYFHSTHYERFDLTIFGTNEKFEIIKKKIIDQELTIDELNEELVNIQNVINDALTHDLNWEGQQCCVDIINMVLNIDFNAQDLSRLSLQKIVRTVSELVFDCALAICALQPLTEWNFGTKKYSLLSSERQLVLLLNKAIVVDRMSLSLHSLEDILSRVNKLADSFLVLNWKVYYAVGFLNFKIHKYEDATRFFEKVCSQKDITDKKEWFHSYLLIAYSYEYSGQFIKAIEQLALTPETINSFLETYECQDIDAAVETILGSIIQAAIVEKKKNLIQLNFEEESYRKEQIEFSNEPEKKKRQIEVLHALAHSLNEFAIRKEKRKREQPEDQNEETNAETKINFAKFTFLARAIMKFIAELEPEYWTCYATIHGEYTDYHQAITYLDDTENQIKQETLLAERLFFRYYFKQMLGEDDETDREKFKAYCSKYSDNDADCHIKIFEFRTEFRKCFSDFFDKLGGANFDLEFHERVPEIPQKLKEQYEELCVLNPTLYMNVNVRVELRKMQRAYRCLEALIEYIKDNNERKHSVLVNACNRFCRTRSEFHIDSNEPKIAPTNIKDVFFAAKGSISYCLHNSDSIFLLAPISGVVVYQYQTGTIDTLFNIHSIGDESFQCEVDWGQLINKYTEDYILRERPIIEGIDWNSMPSDVNSVFCWRENDPSNIIVAQRNNSCYTRKIVDSEAFYKSIEQLIEKGRVNYNCTQRGVNIGNRCLVSSVNRIEWLEVVNNNSEDINNILSIFHRLQNDVLQCFIVLSGESIDCHKFHRGVMRAFWSYEDSSSSVNSDNKTEQIDEEETIALGKKYLKEILKNIKSAITLAETDDAQKTLKKYEELLKKYSIYDENKLSLEDVKAIVGAYPDIKGQFDTDFRHLKWGE
jgi:hypothetical protein